MSRWAATCDLIEQRTRRDEYGVDRTAETRRRVPCNVMSMGAASYYAAAAAGVRPEAVVQIRSALYRGERLAALDGVVMAVDRVSHTSPDFIALTLAERMGNRG